MKYRYRTAGTCSQVIEFELDDNGIIVDVAFYGGCDGNLKGICALVRGMDASDVVGRLRGIRCGMKSTSCPDQLAQALESVIAKTGN